MNNTVRVPRPSYISISFIFLAFLSVFLSRAAFAQGKTPNWKAREMSAKKFCNVGEYQKGIDILGDLYVETNVATYLYNQARCYQQNDQYEKAIARFREYVRKSPNLTPEEKQQVDEHIADCQEQLKKQSVTVPPENAPPTVREPSSTITKPDPLPEISPVTPTEDDGRGLRIAGLITGSVGLVGLAAGGVLNWQHQKKYNDYKTKDPRPDNADEELNRLKTFSIIGFAIGGAALFTGSLLYYFGYRVHSSTDPTSVAVVPLPGEIHLVWRGTL